MTSVTDNCPICQEPLSNTEVVITKCQHFFHSHCHITHLITESKKDVVYAKCPLCRAQDDKSLDVIGELLEDIDDMKDHKESILKEVRKCQDTSTGLFATLKAIYLSEHHYTDRAMYSNAVNNALPGFEADLKYHLGQIKDVID